MTDDMQMDGNHGVIPEPSKWFKPDIPKRCPRCGGKLVSDPVSVWCENVVFKNGTISPDGQCDYALMSG